MSRSQWTHLYCTPRWWKSTKANFLKEVGDQACLQAGPREGPCFEEGRFFEATFLEALPSPRTHYEPLLITIPWSPTGPPESPKLAVDPGRGHYADTFLPELLHKHRPPRPQNRLCQSPAVSARTHLDDLTHQCFVSPAAVVSRVQ